MPAIRNLPQQLINGTDSNDDDFVFEYTDATSKLHLEAARTEFSLRNRTRVQPPTRLPSPSPTPEPDHSKDATSPLAPRSTLTISVPKLSPSVPKRRKPPNAFILFRSYALANGLLPSSVKLQNDVSVRVGQLWHEQPASVQNEFKRRADAEKRRLERLWKEAQMVQTTGGQPDAGSSAAVEKTRGTKSRPGKTVRNVAESMRSASAATSVAPRPRTKAVRRPIREWTPIPSPGSSLRSSPSPSPTLSSMSTYDSSNASSPPASVSEGSPSPVAMDFETPAAPMIPIVELPPTDEIVPANLLDFDLDLDETDMYPDSDSFYAPLATEWSALHSVSSLSLASSFRFAPSSKGTGNALCLTLPGDESRKMTFDALTPPPNSSISSRSTAPPSRPAFRF